MRSIESHVLVFLIHLGRVAGFVEQNKGPKLNHLGEMFIPMEVSEMRSNQLIFSHFFIEREHQFLHIFLGSDFAF